MTDACLLCGAWIEPAEDPDEDLCASCRDAVRAPHLFLKGRVRPVVDVPTGELL